MTTRFRICNCYLTGPRSLNLLPKVSALINLSRNNRRSLHITSTSLDSISTNPSNLICLSFYKFFEIENPDDFVTKARENLSLLDIKGTLYVASEGINGQFAIPDTKYSSFVKSISKIDNNLNDLDLNIGEILPNLNKNPFKKLLIRVRDKILRDGLSSTFDWQDCGPEIEPEEWHNLISSKSNDTILFDCRNGYESDVGKFNSSVPLNTEIFSESWDKLDELLHDVPRDKTIATYCTGGIRCVKVNAYLKQKLGFTNTVRLKKGIIAYDNWIQSANTREKENVSDAQPPAITSQFIGKNFLFDKRRLWDVKEEENSISSNCEKELK